MAIRTRGGRYAATNWQVVEQFANNICLARIGIETGRTHQIRVHMASLGAPVLGDRLYGGGLAQNDALRADRQMLHSRTISFIHPTTGRECRSTNSCNSRTPVLFAAT